MIKFLISTASAAALFSTSVVAQYVAPAGSDYAKATTEVYTEDAMNEFLSMANSFACIIKNSRSDLTGLSNATWEASIDEVECGLASAPANGQNPKARAVMTSSRASATSPQESTAWFASSDGMKFTSSMAVSKSPTEFGPYGAWYVSYMLREMDADAASSTTNYTTANTKIIGFVDISDAGAGKILIQSAERGQGFAAGHNETTQSKIEYADATLNSATLVGRFDGTDPEGNSVDATIAGRTSDTHYFRIKVGSPADSACLLRDSTWSTVHNYDVFNKATGQKVALSGAFGFEYGASGSRGWFDQNGAWFDGGGFAFNDSNKKTLAVKDREKNDYTLTWAPGRLLKKTMVPETLANGTTNKFKAYVETAGEVEAIITINGGGAASLQYKRLDNGNLVSDPWNDAARSGHNFGDTIDAADMSVGNFRDGWDHLGWLYSEEKRAMVYWNGSTTINVEVRQDMSSDPTLLAANHTVLTQNGDDGLQKDELPVNLTEWVALAQGADWPYLRGNGSPGDVAQKTVDGAAFYFTGLAPTGFAGIMPRTLYQDNGAAGPDLSDKAVMFDFARNEGTQKYDDFAEVKYTGNTGNWNQNWNWPHANIKVKSATTDYEWSFGANPWDQSAIALKPDGSVKPVDQPLMLTYEHTTAKERNTVAAGITYFVTPDNYEPLKSLCSTTAGGVRKCTVTPTSFNGKKFILEYNGSHLGGLPHQQATYAANGDKSYGVSLVNPKDGETVVGNDGVDYVVKAREVATSFVPATVGVYDPGNPVFYDPNVVSAADCDDLSFDALDDLGAGGATNGWQIADLPSAHTPAGLAKFPQSTKTWHNLPAVSELKCSVSQGVPDGCD